MNDVRGKADLSALRDVLPPWIPRNWQGWKQNIPLSPRTLANEDSKGSGVKVRMLIGNVVAYERNSLIEFLEGKSRVLGSGGCRD